MLSEKPWKLEVVIRLLVAVVICVFTGSLLISGLRFEPAKARVAPLAFYAVVACALVFSIVALVLTLRRWQLEKSTWRLAALMLCLFASLNLAVAAQYLAGPADADQTSVGSLILSLASFQGAALVLIGWFLHQHRIRWAEAFGFSAASRGRCVLLGLIVAFVFTPLGWLLQSGCAKLFLLFHYEPREQHLVEFLRLHDAWPDRVYLGLSAVVLAPLAEEMLFRGILYPTLKQLGFPRAALWVTALLFAAIHGNLVAFLPLVFFAVVLTMLYERTNNLLACITTHSVFNAMNFVALYAAEYFSQVPAQP